MSHKRFSPETILKLLGEIEANRAQGMRVHTACRRAGISDTTYYKWRIEHGG